MDARKILIDLGMDLAHSGKCAAGSGAHFNPEPGRLMYRTQAEDSLILPSPHPAVMFREVSDGAVLLQMEDEIYFGLNEVGARVWQLLPPISSSLEELVASMALIYPDVPSDQLSADVAELIDQLRENKLLVDTPVGEA